MTTPSTERKAGPLLGTGAQTAWPFTFKVFAATDIAVTIATSLGVETALVYGVDYSVSLNANQETSPGGTVTYPISGAALPVGARLVIFGNLPYDQPLDLPSGGNFSPLALENELDRLTMQIQQLREQVGRAVQVSVTTNANVGLPPPAASQLIGWDSTGENLENVPLSELGTAIAYGTYRYDTFTGDGVTTSYLLSEDPAVLANLDVSISGVVQVPGTDYALVTGSLVFTSAPSNGTTILARYGQALPALPDSDQTTFVQAGAGAATRTVQNKLRDVVSVKDFGAVGDGVTDDHVAIRAACATGLPVTFPKGAYNFGTYAAPQDLLLDHDNQALFLQGSELRFVGKGVINVDASNVSIDLQGGVLSQYIGYAEVAANTISGGNQITVVDSSTLFVGQNVTSSWGNSGGSGVYPLGGPTDPNPKTITSIVGNTVTLSANMTPGDILVPQVIFGDFTFGVFLQCFQTNFVVKNGTIERTAGYYYHSPNGIDTVGMGFRGGDIYFQNIDFNGNGTDQFLIKMEQKLHFNNCRAVQQWDTAKTGVYFADSGSLYMTDCKMALGNFDASITMFNIWQPVTGFGQGGEIVLSNCTITGQTRFVSPPPASQGQDNLHAIEPIYQGRFNIISVSNCRFAGYTRQFISSTVEVRTVNTVLDSLRIDNCLIDGSFGYFLHSGAGNGFVCGVAQISNTSFYQRNAYTFHYADAISGAGTSMFPNFSNCYFNFGGDMAGFAKFDSKASVSNSTFNMNGIAYTHVNGVAELDNCLFTNNPTISIAPTYDENFYGELSRIVIDDPDFPANPGAVFTALGGSSLSGAKLATARSINGSVFYDIYKLGSTIRASGVFSKANGVYKLRADDYYVPIGSSIKDMYLGTIQRVTFSYPPTLTAAATAGATSIVVSDATGVLAGDLVNILLNDVLVDTLVVDPSWGGVGLTVPLTSGLTGDAASGNKVNFFRVAAL